MSPLSFSDQIAAACIWFLAGSFTFFVVYNRIILQMDQGHIKTTITFSYLALITGAPLLFGYHTGLSYWLAIPSFLLVTYFLGEIYRKRLQSRYFGSYPLEIQDQADNASEWKKNRQFVLRKYRIMSNTLPALRIVQMSDFHITDRFDWLFFHRCTTTIRKLKPDILLLTGDFVNEAQHIPLIEEHFRNLPGRYGVFASLGNHDYWAGAGAIRSALSNCGIHVISGTCARIEPEPGLPVLICGHEAPWGGVLLDSMLREIPGIPKIVLCHTPDGIFDLHKAGVDIVFSGHLHGGQWRFPILGPLVAPSIHGRLFDFGHYRIGKTDLLVSAGIGVTFIPVRIQCPPEILVVDVIPAESHPIHSNDLETLCFVDTYHY